jgi:hypothetical protein
MEKDAAPAKNPPAARDVDVEKREHEGTTEEKVIPVPAPADPEFFEDEPRQGCPAVGGGRAMMMRDKESGKLEGEGGVIITNIVPDDIVDTRPDQYEGDLDEDESDDDSTSTPVM